MRAATEQALLEVPYTKPEDICNSYPSLVILPKTYSFPSIKEEITIPEVPFSGYRNISKLMPKNLHKDCNRLRWHRLICLKGVVMAWLTAYCCWCHERNAHFYGDFTKNVTSLGNVGVNAIDGSNGNKEKIIFLCVLAAQNPNRDLKEFGSLGAWFRKSRLPRYWLSTIIYYYLTLKPRTFC